jgi:hypothetical protein
MPDICIRVEWIALPEAVGIAPPGAGLYFLGGPFRIRYGPTESRIFYLGSAANLRKRLSQHYHTKRRGNVLLTTIASPTKENVVCSIHHFPGLSPGRALGLEAATQYAFGVKHGFIPHGNRLPVEYDEVDEWQGHIEIAEALSDDVALLEETEIAIRYNLDIQRDSCPVFNSLSLTLELSHTGSPTVKCQETPKIYTLNFVPKRAQETE